ncbi:MAG TPA: N-acetylneuraminate synthase family protein [Tepidisphaeraceae bacterium]
MKIAGRTIRDESPVLVIAEIGVNHDGSRDRALELVRHARDAGADAVKLQVFGGEKLMHPSARFADYQADRVTATDPVAMLRQYELSDGDLRKIAQAASAVGLLTIATPFSPSDVERVVNLGAEAIKIASPDLVNRVLLREAAATNLPLIVSTGAATLSEISDAVAWLRTHCANFCLLHCISSYPTAMKDASLRWIGQLGDTFGVPIGYSDHTTEPLAGALAVAAGACVVEKHLTYDVAAAGPDHSASASPDQLKQYVQAIRVAEEMRGTGSRRVLACEEDVRFVSRQSLVLARSVSNREVFTRSCFTTQRPASGISSQDLELVIGERATQDIPAGTILMPAMVQGWRNEA